MKVNQKTYLWINPTFLFTSITLLFLVSLGCSVPPAGKVSEESHYLNLSSSLNAEQHMKLGDVFYRKGVFGEAVAWWKKAAIEFERNREVTRECESLIKIAHATQLSGHYAEAGEILGRAISLAKKLNNKEQIAVILNCIGDNFLALGDVAKAEKHLLESLRISLELGDGKITASILNNFGNLYALSLNYERALEFYNKSIEFSREVSDHLLTATALTNSAVSALKLNEFEKVRSLINEAYIEIKKAPDSHFAAYALINIALIYRDLQNQLAEAADVYSGIMKRVLEEAISMAENLEDALALSYGYGYLGWVYENKKQYKNAVDYTRVAIFSAQDANSKESLYRWEWQLGRLLVISGDLDRAIESYRRAVFSLQSIRQEMSRCYGRSGPLFREIASPVYFEFVDLLLQKAATFHQSSASEPYLVEARETIEKLKVFELQEYFRDDCVGEIQSKTTRLESVTKTGVVIYPIILKNRLELLVSTASGLKRFTTAVAEDELVKEVRVFRKLLEKRTTREYLPHAQKLYDWLIRSIDLTLRNTKVNTLIFIPDGCLRTIPMAALHDGKKFLVERYATAITPGLNLTDPKPLDRRNIKTLAAGLTEARMGFPRLPYVYSEIQTIHRLYGAASLLDHDFTISRMQKELAHKNFSIVHIASHGLFGSNPDDTYLLAFDGKLTMDKLKDFVGLFKFRDTPLELLTLSACQTAAGDDRAALGLAGVAVRSGARSALATLWFINDMSSSELIAEFYRQLEDPHVSRAVALQKAQLKLLHTQGREHPAYWAPFLLINNWL